MWKAFVGSCLVLGFAVSSGSAFAGSVLAPGEVLNVRCEDGAKVRVTTGHNQSINLTCGAGGGTGNGNGTACSIRRDSYFYYINVGSERYGQYTSEAQALEKFKLLTDSGVCALPVGPTACSVKRDSYFFYLLVGGEKYGQYTTEEQFLTKFKLLTESGVCGGGDLTGSCGQLCTVKRDSYFFYLSVGGEKYGQYSTEGQFLTKFKLLREAGVCN